MSKRIIFVCLLAVTGLQALPQVVKGVVYALEETGGAKQKKEPLPGANVYWSGTQQGTSTDVKGKFQLPLSGITDPTLVVSYIGFRNDSIQLSDDQRNLEILLTVNNTLKEVVIANKAPGTFISRLDPIYTEKITGAELQRAACCNLSESFETNASVDVSYSDAVTGAKQIQLLGLRGTYSQIMTENIPNLRGLATTFGLGYIPGPWMESIQVSKGNLASGLSIMEETKSTWIKSGRKFTVALSDYNFGKIYAQLACGGQNVNLSMILKNIRFLIKNLPFAARKAENYFQSAIRQWTEMGSKGWVGRASLDLGRLHKMKG